MSMPQEQFEQDFKSQGVYWQAENPLLHDIFDRTFTERAGTIFDDCQSNGAPLPYIGTALFYTGGNDTYRILDEEAQQESTRFTEHHVPILSTQLHDALVERISRIGVNPTLSGNQRDDERFAKENPELYKALTSFTALGKSMVEPFPPEETKAKAILAYVAGRDMMYDLLDTEGRLQE